MKRTVARPNDFEEDGCRLEWVPHLSESLRPGLLALLAASVGDDAMLGHTAAPEGASGERWLARLDAELRAEQLMLLVARGMSREVVGMVALEPGGLATQRHQVGVRRAFIHPLHRGSRLLFDALQEILAQCAAHGWTTVLIDVREGTRAERLWRRLGFRQYGRLEDYAHYAGRTHAGVFLTASPEELACTLRQLDLRARSSRARTLSPRSEAF